MCCSIFFTALFNIENFERGKPASNDNFNSPYRGFKITFGTFSCAAKIG